MEGCGTHATTLLRDTCVLPWSHTWGISALTSMLLTGVGISGLFVVSQHCRWGLVYEQSGTGLDRRKQEVDTRPRSKGSCGHDAHSVHCPGWHSPPLQGLIYSCLETKRALAILSHIYQMKRVLYCRCSGSNIWHTQNGRNWSLLLSNTQARATKDYLRKCLFTTGNFSRWGRPA